MHRPIITGSLVAVLLAVLVCGCASLGKGPADGERIAGMLADWKAALEAHDVDKLMTAYSEDFEGRGGAGKEQVREFLQGAIDQGYLDGAEISLEDAETTIDGGTASVGPVVLSSDRGAMEIELKLIKESDGAWRIVGSDRV